MRTIIIIFFLLLAIAAPGISAISAPHNPTPEITAVKFTGLNPRVFREAERLSNTDRKEWIADYRGLRTMDWYTKTSDGKTLKHYILIEWDGRVKYFVSRWNSFSGSSKEGYTIIIQDWSLIK